MKKKIGILGSTGSICENTVKIISKNINDFEVIFLSTNNNIKKLYKQSIIIHPRAVIGFYEVHKFLITGLYLLFKNRAQTRISVSIEF